MTINERAAAMRQAWLGDAAGEAVAWNELKQCVRDRWLAALDAAQPEVPQGVPSVDELAEIGWQANRNYVVHESAATAIRDAVLAGVQAGATVTMIGKTLTPDTFGPEDGTPAPLSDEIIERMAKAAHKQFGNHNWGLSPFKNEWCLAIRAALAAVGPQYNPADVAFNSRVPELEKAAERLTERLAAVSAKSHRRKVALKQMQHGLAAWKAVATHYQQGRRNHEVNYNAMQAERDALRAELAAAEIELADKSFYVREFAAVSAERDAARAELAAVKADNKDKGDVLRQIRNILDAMGDECETLTDQAKLAVQQVKSLRSELEERRAEQAPMGEEIVKLRAELAALRERAAVPVPAGVPSVRDLREIGVHAYLSHDSAKRENAGCMVGPMGAAADAIRDAVLRGAEQPSSNAGQFDDDEVEALARVLREPAQRRRRKE